MQDALADEEGSDSNPNTNNNNMINNSISDTILATGVFTSAELYKLARSSITTPTSTILGSLSLQSHLNSHHHHQTQQHQQAIHSQSNQEQHLLAQEHSHHVIKGEHESSPSYLNCNNHGEGSGNNVTSNAHQTDHEGSNGNGNNSNHYSPDDNQQALQLSRQHESFYSHYEASSPSHLSNNAMRITKRKRDSLEQTAEQAASWVQGSLDSFNPVASSSNPYSSSDPYYSMEPVPPEAAWVTPPGPHASFTQSLSQSHHHAHRHIDHHGHPPLPYLHHEGRPSYIVLYAPSENTVVSSLQPMTSSERPSPNPYPTVASPGPTSDIVKTLPSVMYETSGEHDDLRFGSPTPVSSSDPF